MTKTALNRRLSSLETAPPKSWRETGLNARPNLHGLLRYPAMMVPCMQGDIIDAILAHRPGPCRVLDPFVGLGHRDDGGFDARSQLHRHRHQSPGGAGV